MDVEFTAPNASSPDDAPISPSTTKGSGSLLSVPGGQQGSLTRSQSRAFLSDDGMPQPIEFFIASDASAIVEHTKRVLYLEDDDIAHIAEGGEFLGFHALLEQKKASVHSPFFFLRRVPHPQAKKGRWSFLNSCHRDSRNRARRYHEGILQPFHVCHSFLLTLL